MQRFIPHLSALVLLLATQMSAAADAVVGNGQPSSCTDAALNAAINTVQSDSQGGTVSFNCGSLIGGRTISIAAQKTLTGFITIDGGGSITLDGQASRRIFEINPRPNPEDVTLVTLKNLVLNNAFAAGGFGGAVLGNGGVQLNLQNVSINDSRAGLSGGAVAMAPNTTLNVTDSSFRNNAAPDGGAIATSAVTAVTGSRFVLNTASGTGNNGQGGAIQSYAADLSIENSSFSFNLGNFGGAIFKRDARIFVDDTSLENNTAGADGGAMFAQSSVQDFRLNNARFLGNIASTGGGGAISANRLDAERCLFNNNRAQYGGAIAIQPSATERAVLSNCTLSNNFAQVNGGAAEILSSTGGGFYAYQVTTSNNSANVSGGDFYFGDVEALIERSSILDGIASISFGGGGGITNIGGSVSLGGSLIFSRQGQDCAGTGSFQSLGANIGGASCNLTNPGSALVQADQIVISFAQLGLGEFGNYGGPFANYLPLANSPALNTFICSDFDARGLSRPVGSRCDSGAVERQLSEQPAALFRNGFEGPGL